MDSSFFAVFILCGMTFWTLILAGKPVLTLFPLFTLSLTKIFDILIAAIFNYFGMADYDSYVNIITFFSFGLSIIIIAAFALLIIGLASNRKGISESETTLE